MFELAIMLKARIQLLPLSNPAAHLLDKASGAHCDSWAWTVQDLQSGGKFGQVIPNITDTISKSDVDAAHASKAVRDKQLARYRANTVGPVLQEYDDSKYSKALANSSWPYGNFQSKLDVCPPQLLLVRLATADLALVPSLGRSTRHRPATGIIFWCRRIACGTYRVPAVPASARRHNSCLAALQWHT